LHYIDKINFMVKNTVSCAHAVSFGLLMTGQLFSFNLV